MVGASVGDALGVSDTDNGGGSVGIGEGSAVGCNVRVGVRVGIFVGGVEFGTASICNWGTTRRWPR